MKLIKPFVCQLHSGYTLDDIFKSIAEAAKVCYRTEKTSLSDKEFVKMLINKDHLRPLEMSTVYLKVDWYALEPNNRDPRINDIIENHWTKWASDPKLELHCITTNFRVIYETFKWWDENANVDELLSSDYFLWKYLTPPMDAHYKRYTYEFICSRGCADDFRTHVGLSSIMESSRYCNYSKDKFGNEITFIEPYWDYTNEDIEDFEAIERIYMKKISQGYQPQQAKNYLGLGYATKLRMCGFYDAWHNFVIKRDNDAAYPECHKLANSVNKLLHW